MQLSTIINIVLRVDDNFMLGLEVFKESDKEVLRKTQHFVYKTQYLVVYNTFIFWGAFQA